MPEPGEARRSTSHGFGRVLVFVYGVFALSATARSLVQLATKAGQAPVAYSLSAVAGAVYVVATWALATDRHRVALSAVLTELVGVLGVGALSLLQPQDFADQTVWSGFGAGYGYVPLVLPFVGLWWLRRQMTAPSSSSRRGPQRRPGN